MDIQNIFRELKGEKNAKVFKKKLKNIFRYSKPEELSRLSDLLQQEIQTGKPFGKIYLWKAMIHQSRELFKYLEKDALLDLSQKYLESKDNKENTGEGLNDLKIYILIVLILSGMEIPFHEIIIKQIENLTAEENFKLQDSMFHKLFDRPIDPELNAIFHHPSPSILMLAKGLTDRVICRSHTQYLESLFKSYSEYPMEFQQYLLDLIMETIPRKQKEVIVSFMLSNKNMIYGQFPERSTKWFQEIDVLQETWKKKNENRKIEEEEQNQFSKEFQKRKIEYIDKPFKKADELKLVRHYRALFIELVKEYKSYFEEYFAKHPNQSLVAFDIEEIYMNMACVVGVRIDAELNVRLRIIMLDNLYLIRQANSSLFHRFKEWLTTVEGDIILSHGTNQKEENLAQRSGFKSVNTQNILEREYQHPEPFYYKLSGIGLAAFEKIFGFKRKACGIFKHQISHRTYFHQVYQSFENIFLHKDMHICNICHKPQDVLEYCMEDVFVTILIYLHDFHRKNLQKR